MASLNLSTNGLSITKSYQSIVDSPLPTGSVASSSTYGQWALYSVSTPLANAFQQDAGSKESLLKVQSTGGKLLHVRTPIPSPKSQFGIAQLTFDLCASSRRARRPDRGLLRRKDSVRVREDQRSQHSPTEICSDRLGRAASHSTARSGHR